jgi:hypothetical protein
MTDEPQMEQTTPTETTGTEEESESYKYPDASVLLPIKIIRDALTIIDSGVLSDLTPALVLSLARAWVCSRGAAFIRCWC